MSEDKQVIQNQSAQRFGQNLDVDTFSRQHFERLANTDMRSQAWILTDSQLLGIQIGNKNVWAIDCPCSSATTYKVYIFMHIFTYMTGA